MGDEQPREWDLEQVYDEQISPLMAQIIAICKEHNLPFVASFEFAPGSFCTSAILPVEADQRLKMGVQMLRHGFVAYTTVRRGEAPH